MCVLEYHSPHAEVRGQLRGVSSLLPPCRAQASNPVLAASVLTSWAILSTGNLHFKQVLQLSPVYNLGWEVGFQCWWEEFIIAYISKHWIHLFICFLGSPWAWFVSEDDLKLLICSPPSPKCWGCRPNYKVLRIEPGASCMLGKHSANRAILQISLDLVENVLWNIKL